MKFLLSIFLFFSSHLISNSLHWDCIPNDDYIEFADCTSNNGQKVRVLSPDELGKNFTVTAKFPSGSIFEGKSVDGKVFGKRSDPDGTIIEGFLEGIYFEGEGTITYPEDDDRDRYTGYISVDEPNGQGVLYYKDFSDFDYAEGIFKEGEHESAIYYQRNGLIVKGKLVDGRYDGYVEVDYTSDDLLKRYEGYSADTFRQGYGKLTYLSGDIYEGNFFEDMRSGYGVYTFNPDNLDEAYYSRAEGNWVNDSLNGQARLYYKDGTLIYSGNVIAGVENGLGTSFFEGGTYVGEHKDGMPNGNGKMMYDDGEYYEGFVVDGVSNGPGKLYLSSTNETFIGNFQDDLLQGEGEYINGDEGWRYNGPFKDGLFNGIGEIILSDGETYYAEYEEGIYLGEEDFIPDKTFKRVALVIGNDNYESSPLDNAISDSIGIKIALEGNGFEVIHETDLTQASFLGALEKFERALKKYGPSTEALFYYAGHAVQVDGINYLNPIDADIKTKYDLDIRSINISRIFSILEKKVSGVKIVILDACRNNPFNSFVRSPKLGLAQMNAPSGMIISYSTAPGSVALDGTSDGYGFFTGSLVNAINTPGLTIEEVFKKTRQSVVSLTKRQQIPWESSSLLGDFYFKKIN